MGLNTKKIILGILGIGIVLAGGVDSISQNPNFTSIPIPTLTASGTIGQIIQNGVVINSIVLPTGWPNIPNAWTPPPGTQIILNDQAGINDIYDGSNFFYQAVIPQTFSTSSVDMVNTPAS